MGGCVRGRAPRTRLAARVSARVYASLVLARRFCDLGSCIGKLHRYRHRETSVCTRGQVSECIWYVNVSEKLFSRSVCEEKICGGLFSISPDVRAAR